MNSNDAILAEFIDAYFADKKSSGVRSLDHYIAQFPGFADTIAREYLRLTELLTGDPLSTPTVNTYVSGAPGERLGDYELLRELGRGAQGVVYEARDHKLGRIVAIKVLRGFATASKEMVARFRREALVMARLQDPGICQVHDAGVLDGVPYIVMSLIDGKSLDKRISTMQEAVTFHLEAGSQTSPKISASLTPKTAIQKIETDKIADSLGIIEHAARALHVAHEAGVIHRDIKPGNIMIRPGGQPVIMDFGLARSDDSTFEALSESGDIFGTPAYMSPEQIQADPNRIRLDRRTDVWSLGASLYELVTHQRPFEGNSREALYNSILNLTPSRIRSLNPAISRDLEIVICHVLEKDRNKRYQTALEFAEDLRRVRQHEPIKAKPVSQLTKFARWAQRNPTVAALTATVFLTLAGGLVATMLQMTRADRNAASSDANRLMADLRYVQSLVSLGDARVSEGRTFESEDVYLEALSLQRRLRIPTLSTETGLWEADNRGLCAIHSLRHETLNLDIFDGSDFVIDDTLLKKLSISSDASRVLTWSPRALRIWDSMTGMIVKDVPNSLLSCAGAVFVGGNSRRLIPCADGALRYWDIASETDIWKTSVSSESYHLAVSSDDHVLLTASVDGALKLWDISTGTGIAEFSEHQEDIAGLTISANGKVAMSWNVLGEFWIWDVDARRVLWKLKDRAKGYPMAALSADGTLALTNGPSWGEVQLWDIATGNELRTLSRHKGDQVHSIAFIGTLGALTGADDGTLVIWDLSHGRQLASIEAHRSDVRDIAIDPSFRLIVSIGDDGLVKIWAKPTGGIYNLLPFHRVPPPNSGAFSPDGRMIVTAHNAGIVMVWDTETGRELLVRRTGDSDEVRDATFSADGEYIISGGIDGNLRIWKIDTKEPAATIKTHHRIYCVAASPNGNHALTGGK